MRRVTEHRDEGTVGPRYLRVGEKGTIGGDAASCLALAPAGPNTYVEPIMLHRIADRARMLAMTVGPLVVVALVLVAGRRWV